MRGGHYRSLGPTSPNSGGESLSRGHLRDEIAARLKRKVFAAQLLPRQRLDQDALCNELGVSRVPLREALAALEREGIIVNVPRHGSYVADLTPQDVLDHYSGYGLIAGEIAARAAARITESDVDALSECLHHVSSEGVRGEDMHRWNTRFHVVINRACGSRRLAWMADFLAVGIAAPLMERDGVGWRAATYDDHSALLNVLRAGDATSARETMTAHVSRIGDFAAEALQLAGFWADSESLSTTSSELEHD